MSARMERALIRAVQDDPIYKRVDDAASLWDEAVKHAPTGTAVPGLHVWLARRGLIVIHAEEGALAVLRDWRVAVREIGRRLPRNLDEWAERDDDGKVPS